MSPRRQEILLCLLVVSPLCCAPWVSAQDIQSELSQKVNELHERVKPESAAEAQRREVQAGKQLDDLERLAEPLDASSPRDPRFEILSHHRGSQGAAFPSRNDVVVEIPAHTAPHDVSESLKEYWVASSQARQRPIRCSRSDTTTIPRRKKGASDEVLSDRLYVWKELVPVDHAEVYGANTRVEAYDGDQAEEVLVQMEADVVPCVPYRVRYTATHVFHHTGEDALGNFDRNPTGRGVLHRWASQRAASLP